MAVKRVIKLLGDPLQTEHEKAGAEITPGMLLEFDSNGDVIPHGTAGGSASRDFAGHREEMGQDIDDTYAVGETVKVMHFAQGMRVNAIIPSGQNISKDGFLESNGNGMLKAFGSGQRVGRALEAVNNTAGPGSARLRVEIV